MQICCCSTIWQAVEPKVGRALMVRMPTGLQVRGFGVWEYWQRMFALHKSSVWMASYFNDSDLFLRDWNWNPRRQTPLALIIS